METGVVAKDKQDEATQPIIKELLMAMLLDRDLALPMYKQYKKHVSESWSGEADPSEMCASFSTFGK
eukprot:9354044-Alexandrium_andersonii.AAC.1